MTPPCTPSYIPSLLLGLALVLAPAAQAAGGKAEKARAAFDLMDRQDFLDGIEQAGGCTERNDFACAEKALADIKGLASTPEQEQLWQSASREVQNGRKRMAQEQAIAQAQRAAEQARLAAQQQAQQGGSTLGSMASFAAGMALGGVGGGSLGNLDSTLKRQVTKAVVSEGINSLANRAAAPAQPAMTPQQFASAPQSPQSLQALQTIAARSPGATGGPGASAGTAGGGAWTPEPNTLLGSPACSGYSNGNYQQYYEAHKQEDEQLHSICAAAFNYYAAYLNARAQGYTRQQAQPTYDMFQKTARVATDFHAQAGAH